MLATNCTAAERDALRTDRLKWVLDRATEDLLAVADKDPAARGSWRYVWESYRSYRATLAYRLAHAIHTAASDSRDLDHSGARKVSEAAKVETGVEIHPAARIGRRFVLDHGVGTVIGETVVIGDDAYILQGVILGSRGIANNPTGGRHPQLGDRVQIGSFARVFGPVTIGDDVQVSPHTVVTSDVPAGRRVQVFNQYQATAGQCSLRVFGVVPASTGAIDIHGRHLCGVTVELVSPTGEERHPVPVVVATDRLIRCAAHPVRGDERLVMRHECGAETVVHHLGPLWQELAGRVYRKARA